MFNLIALQPSVPATSANGDNDVVNDSDNQHEPVPGTGSQFLLCAHPYGNVGKSQQAVIAPLPKALLAALSSSSDAETVLFVQNLPPPVAGRRGNGVTYAVSGWLKQLMEWTDVMTTTFVLYGKGSDLYQVCSAILL